MTDELQMAMDEAKESMENTLDHLKRELTSVRTGKASTEMFSQIKVDYYGSLTPLSQVATVSLLDARSILIKPWEKTMLEPIEKSIFQSNMGLTPQNDGETVRINIPMLTEERRKDLVKQVKGYAEDGKVSLRGARQKLMSAIKTAVKDGFPEDQGKRVEGDAEKLTQEYANLVEKVVEAKEKDIMTI